MEEIQAKLKQLEDRFEKISAQIDRDELRVQIRDLELQTTKEGFWQDQKKATGISKQLAEKQKTLENLESLEQRISDALELSGLEDVPMETEVKEIESFLDKLELKLFLSNPHDESEAIFK